MKSDKLLSIRIPSNLRDDFQIHCYSHNIDVSTAVRSFMQWSLKEQNLLAIAYLDKLQTFFKKVEDGDVVTGKDIGEASQILGIKAKTLQKIIEAQKNIVS